MLKQKKDAEIKVRVSAETKARLIVLAGTETLSLVARTALEEYVAIHDAQPAAGSQQPFKIQHMEKIIAEKQARAKPIHYPHKQAPIAPQRKPSAQH